MTHLLNVSGRLTYLPPKSIKFSRRGTSPPALAVPQEEEQPQVQNHFDNIMFENIEQQIWYDTHFLTKTIISERPVVYENFEHIGVRQNLAEGGWLNYVKLEGLAYECLVREFYNNAQETGPRKLRAYVRGIAFKFHHLLLLII